MQRAEAAQKDSIEAIVAEAAKPGCRANCAKLLQNAKDAADADLADARRALDAFPLPPPSDSLAATLGIRPVIWGLIMGVLRSLAIIGASIMLGYVLHPGKSASAPSVTAQTAPSQPIAIAERPTRRGVSMAPRLELIRPAREQDLELEHVVRGAAIAA